MTTRRTHSPEFKARVAMEAISGRKTLQEIAADHAIHPIQVSQWTSWKVPAICLVKAERTRKEEISRLERQSSFRRSAGSRWSWNGLKKSQLLDRP